MSNSSSITQFLLLALADTRELQLLTFWLLLGIYLAALLANSVIITAVAGNQHLHVVTQVKADLKETLCLRGCVQTKWPLLFIQTIYIS